MDERKGRPERATSPSYPGCAESRRTRSAAWKSTGLPRNLRLTLAPPGARQLAGRKIRASGSNTGSLEYSRRGCGTRRALRGFENTSARRLELVCSGPVSRAEHRHEAGSRRETFDRARGALFSARRVRLAPGFVRSAGNRPVCGRRSDPGVLSFGYLSLHEQRKVTQGAGAEPPAISFSSSPKAIRP